MSFLPAVIAVPLIAAALVPLAQLFGDKTRNAFAVTAGFLTAAFALALIPAIRQGTGFSFLWLPGFSPVGINLDTLSVNIAVIAATIGSLIVLYSTKYMEKEEGGMRYYALVLLFIGAMIGLVLSDNFLMMYIFWEIVGVCSYALIGFFYKDPKAVNAGIKAFITTRIGDVGLLIGILILFVNTGTFNIALTADRISSVPPALLAVAAFGFLLGAVGKSAQLPLHVWLPDAMEAPTPISALIHAATMVNAGVYLMARVFPMFHSVPYWALTLTWIGVLTAFLAASMALVEKDLKRVLAYSTVSQLGFMMLSIGVGGLLASQFHLMSHAIFKALLFLSAGAIIHEVGTRNMHEMGGLFKEMKITGWCFLAGSLALMGIPVFNGFFSKDLILVSAYHSGNMWAYALAVATAVITILYSLRMFYLVFLGKRKGAHVHDAPWQMTGVLVALGAGTLVSWLSISRFSSSFAHSGLEAEHLGIKELLMEMFASSMTIVTALIIAAGFILYYYRKPVMNALAVAIDPFLNAARNGFWFDAFYKKIIDALFASSAAVLDVFDGRLLNGFNYAVGSAFASFSQVFRRTHPGELNYNLLGMIAGLAFILAAAFWR